MEHLRCVVERITYQNAENGYSVIKCRAKAYQDLVTVVGSMPHQPPSITKSTECSKRSRIS